MTSPSTPWRFETEISPSLPALAWIALIKGQVVRVRCGASVRIDNDGFFEGTWAGPAILSSVARQETVFGSGIVRDGRELVVVTPAHTIEPVYLAYERDGHVIVSNSFVGLLVATGRSLNPATLYPPLFGLINRGLSHGTIEIPTTTDPITIQYFENVVVNVDGSTRIRPKPRNDPFVNFEGYRDLLIDRVRSSFENAPTYEPAVAMSTGYDSTAAAAVAAQAGCHTAFSFRTGWPWAGYQGEADAPTVSASALGLKVETFDRLAYQALTDAPEAEFLASGMSGEDVVFRSMEPALTGRILASGYWGGATWRGNERPNLMRTDLSGASLVEFRLRSNMIHLPVPYIGGIQQASLLTVRDSEEMRLYRFGGTYDEPIARRLAEEAGVPRGSFGVNKLAASQRIHTSGLAAMSPSGRASFEAFAGADALAHLPRKPAISGRHRFAIKTAHRFHADWAVAGLIERKFRAVHVEPVLGSLMLRWAVEQVRPRYAAVSPEVSDR